MRCLLLQVRKKQLIFVKFCDGFNIPVLTMVNVEGYKATKHEERTIAQKLCLLNTGFCRCDSA